MTVITKFEKTHLNKVLSPAVLAALKVLADEHGLEVRGAGGKFDDTTWTAKLEFKVKDKTAQETKERADFNLFCRMYDLDASDYKRRFKYGNDIFEILGFELKRSKFPIRARNVSTNAVKLLLDTAVDRVKAARPAGWKSEDADIGPDA